MFKFLSLLQHENRRKQAPFTPQSFQIAQDVPKFIMVAGERAQLHGLNLEGLRSHGITVAELRNLRTAYQNIFMPADANSSGFKARLAEVELHDQLAHIPAVYSMVQSIRDSFKEKRRGLFKFKHWNSSLKQ